MTANFGVIHVLNGPPRCWLGFVASGMSNFSLGICWIHHHVDGSTQVGVTEIIVFEDPVTELLSDVGKFTHEKVINASLAADPQRA